MFFENDTFAAQIFTVNRFSWEASVHSVRERPFGALVFRVYGEGSFLFSDGVRMCSHAGDVMYLPHGLGYDVEHSRGEVIAIHFWESSASPAAENFTLRDPCGAAELFFEVHRHFSAGTLSARMEMLSAFYQILSLLGRNDEGGGGENEAFLRAFSILSEEYTDPDLSISSVCERAGISESAFRKSFCARYGKPPIRFLSELRLREAERRLIREDACVKDVALACGFRDVKYFYRVVKRFFGVTPAQLRSI